MKIIEVSVDYSDCDIVTNQTCIVNFSIPHEMTQPIFLFYEIDNFYQNHRRYVRSKSLKQLAGEDISDDEVSKNCDPITHVRDLQEKFRFKQDGTPMDVSMQANPCGLIANSFFDGFLAFSQKLKSSDFIDR